MTEEELRNGRAGPEPGTSNDYSSDPDYEGVDPDLFDYLLESPDVMVSTTVLEPGFRWETDYRGDKQR